METKIKLLPKNVINQIAAGEVIQRPSSIVKELVDNAIDAKSKNIHLIIKDSGKTYIQVIDDKKGKTILSASSHVSKLNSSSAPWRMDSEAGPPWSPRWAS